MVFCWHLAVGAMLNDNLLGEIGSDDLKALVAALDEMEGIEITSAKSRILNALYSRKYRLPPSIGH